MHDDMVQREKIREKREKEIKKRAKREIENIHN